MPKSYSYAFFLYSIVLLCAFNGNAQKHITNTSSHINWSVNPFDRKVFIENKGQLDNDVQADGRILYENHAR